MLLESNHLAQVFRAVSSCQYFDLYVIDLNFFSDARTLVPENFRLFWVDPETHFFSTFLEFAQHFLKLISRGCEQKHVAGKPQVREAVMIVVTQLNSHSFFLLPARNIVFQCFL